MSTETFARYQDYLQQGVYWPKDDPRLGRVETTPIEDMAPQYAASALAKLLRWAYDHGYPALNIYDADERIVYVRRSKLGLALMMRAIGLYEMERMSEIYGPTYPALTQRAPNEEQVSEKALTFAILDEISKANDLMEMMNPTSLAELADDISVGLLKRGYKVTNADLSERH